MSKIDEIRGLLLDIPHKRGKVTAAQIQRRKECMLTLWQCGEGVEKKT